MVVVLISSWYSLPNALHWASCLKTKKTKKKNRNEEVVVVRVKVVEGRPQNWGI